MMDPGVLRKNVEEEEEAVYMEVGEETVKA